jgi:hypothetical protein
MNQDRRASERLTANLQVRWEGSSGAVGCRTEDISITGCFVNTLGIAIIGQTINLEIKLPSGEWMPVKGEVTSYMRGMGFGLAFKFANVEEEIAMRKLLSSITIGALSAESQQSPEPDLRA